MPLFWKGLSGRTMTNYRRSRFEGGYYFFTVVADGRRPLLTTDLARECLHQSFQKVRSQRPFEIVAFCLLPDHLHCIWRLPQGDNAYSVRWSLIKHDFTYQYLRAGGREYLQSQSRKDRRERGIWQRRFWEHQIRDEHDLQIHVDYIHFNPVKHGLVMDVDEWPWSTYHRYLNSGRYRQQNLRRLRQELGELSVGE
jgi:putative transposase